MRKIVMTAVGVVLIAASAGGAAYDVAATEAWRVKREVELKAADGWLTVAGLYFLRPGANSVGADPASDIALPGRAPADAGVIEFVPPRGITFRPKAGVAAMADGEAVTGPFAFRAADRAAKRPASRVTVGGITLQEHRSGQRVAIRLRDPQSPILKEFTALRWFPVDAAWSVDARFIPYAASKTFPTQNILGDSTESTSPGEVEFAVNGQTIRLVAYAAGEKLSFVFSDATAGIETYRLRFLSAAAPVNGRVTIDFNRAYNPPCAFNPYTTCPVPLPQNRLKIAVTAGEKLYKPAERTTAAR